MPFAPHPSAQHACLLLNSDPAMLVRASLTDSRHLPHSVLDIPTAGNALPTSPLWVYVLCGPLSVTHPEEDADAPVCVLLLAHSRSLVSCSWTSDLDLSTPGLILFHVDMIQVLILFWGAGGWKGSEREGGERG